MSQARYIKELEDLHKDACEEADRRGRKITDLTDELVQAEQHIYHLERLIYEDIFGGREHAVEHAHEIRHMAQRIKEGR